MSKHTPGPWQFYRLRGDDGIGYIRPDPEDGIEIAHHGDMDRSPEENDANAKLIAAAPDLLSIVQRFVALPGGAWHPERHAADEAELMEKARATIAKATAP